MAKRIFIVNPEAESIEFGTMEENVFYWERGCAMPAGWSKGVLKEIEGESADELDQELQCMSQIRNPERAKRCRRARGETKFRMLLEADWSAIIIGLWLYMFPFLVGLAGLILDKIW